MGGYRFLGFPVLDCADDEVWRKPLVDLAWSRPLAALMILLLLSASANLPPRVGSLA